MAGIYSSVNLIAGAGILGNVGGVPISANASATTNINTFNSLGVVSQFAAVKSSGSLVLSANTQVALNNLANNIFPVVTNSVPTAYIGSLGNTTVNGFTGLITSGINNILGNNDLGKFEQVVALADSYVIVTNQLINSAVNANDSSAVATYTTQDNTVTGGLSQVTLAFEAFGQDLAALGSAIDLENLNNLGSPQALLKQIYSQTYGSAELNTALNAVGIDQAIINNIGTITMTDVQQKAAFDVMTKITGSALAQILILLRVTTKDLTNLSELLNPVKMFPNSFNTLTAPTTQGLRGIYINSSGAVNSNLETILPSSVLVPLQGRNTQNTYSQLRKIIPPDWALANKALQAGLEQVTAIFNSTLPALSTAVVGLESNKGLNLINALTSPLPASVSNFYSTTYATGTGTNGTLLLADVIGTAGGWVVNGELPAATSVITTLNSAGQLSTLTSGTNGVFTVMQNAINGVYGLAPVTIPMGLPGVGTYDDIDLAFTGPGNVSGIGLIPAAYSLIGTIVANNTANVTIANAAWSNIAAQITLQNQLQSQAGIDFANLVVGSVPNGLVSSLSSYGLDTTEGGSAWFFESVANVSTLGGQAIIATMREARNQELLQNAGVGTNIIVDDAGIETQANNLSSGQYTASEAESQKII